MIKKHLFKKHYYQKQKKKDLRACPLFQCENGSFPKLLCKQIATFAFQKELNGQDPHKTPSHW